MLTMFVFKTLFLLLVDMHVSLCVCARECNTQGAQRRVSTRVSGGLWAVPSGFWEVNSICKSLRCFLPPCCLSRPSMEVLIWIYSSSRVRKWCGGVAVCGVGVWRCGSVVVRISMVINQHGQKQLGEKRVISAYTSR